MQEPEVVAVLDVLDAAGIRVWVEGGWGVDALVGHATRDHDDLDLAVDAADDGLSRAVAALAPTGYAPALDDLPVRLVVASADDRKVDLHPIHFVPGGDAFQRGHDRDYRYPAAGFTVGRLGDRRIPCLSAAVQREFHSGYTPRPVDRLDLARLDALGQDPTPTG
jgi:lincosamide nucleotidyltransferase A/C/D/E